MPLDISAAKYKHSYGGRHWYFCSLHCLDKFAAEPGRYAKAAGGPAPLPGAMPDAIYTCPMHPEIRQAGPGNCPKCGMALEPVAPRADDQPNPELLDMARRFWIGLALTVPEPARHVEQLGVGLVVRSEEHTSELQSPYDLVCRLLLEKKKDTQ